jgi:RHS repeat-associated protein
MPKASGSTQTPAIRPTQFESGSISALKNSINMFRGDVNFQKALITLPGKPNDSALQVQMSVMCESNVSQDVTTWNLDAPTSVLGIGWSLVGERIAAKSSGAASSAGIYYEYQSGGSSNIMIASNVAWVRANLSATISGELGGPKVSSTLIQAFKAAGLRLSAQATIEGETPGPWQVDDPVNEHLYIITLTTLGATQVLQVTDGGQGYDLQNYEFSKIYYYQKYERWEITDSTGKLSVFGGGYAPPNLGITGQGFNTSLGNSVEWSVKWGGASGNWTGSSMQTYEQCQYATAWNLSAEVDLYGDRVFYEYNGFGRTSDGLLARGAEQLVSGEGGLPYTKACYLTKIIDVFGNIVEFTYTDKTFTATAQEYMDPHKVLTPAATNNTPPVNLTTPNAYQDQYETLLLSETAVKTASGELIYKLSFTYSLPINITQTPAGVNVVVNGAPTSEAGELSVGVSLGVDSATVTYQSVVGDTNQQVAQGLWQACIDSPQLINFINVCEVVETPGGAGTYQFLLYANNLDETLEPDQVTVSPTSGQTYLTTAAAPSPTSYEAPQQAAGLVKSYLLAVIEYNAAGDCLPNYSFDYYWAGQGANLGAIKSVTYPDGGKGRYVYAASELSICNREQTVSAPTTQLGSNAVPHVWFGSDYAVTVWTSEGGDKAMLEVHNWTGRWQRWLPKEPLIYSNSDAPIDANTLQLVASEESFVFSFNAVSSTGSSTYLYLYTRDTHKNAAWNELSSGGSYEYNFIAFQDTYAVQIAVGSRFVLVTTQDMTNNEPTYTLYRYTYDWQSAEWNGIGVPLIDPTATPLYVLAHDEYYLCLTYAGAGNNSALQLSYMDALGNWYSGGSLPLNDFNLGDNGNEMMWASGASMIAYTMALNPPYEGGVPAGGKYQMNILRWDADYQFQPLYNIDSLSPLTVPQTPPQSWPPQPIIINNDMVASGQNLWRFTGNAAYAAENVTQGWATASFLPTTDGTAHWIAFAYGEDFTIQVVNTPSGITTTMLVYDANGAGFGPESPPLESKILTPYTATEGYPYASGSDYFTAAGQIFYRGFSTSWDTPISVYTYPSEISASINTLSLINQAPTFMAYAVLNDQDPSSSDVQTLVFENGGMRQPLPAPLTSTMYFSLYTSEGQPVNVNPSGQYPMGMDAFVTYPASTPDGTFQNAQEFTLYRFAGGNISGPITDYYVQLLDVFDGYEQHLYTCYEFNPATAACTSSGEVVEYYQSTTYNGCATPEKSEFGRTVNLYLNEAMADGYSMLNGQSLQTATFAGAALFQTTYSHTLGLDEAKPNQSPIAIPAALITLFGDHGVTLSSSSTLQLIHLTIPTIEGIEQLEGYNFWVIEDPESGDSYNLDFNGDPTSASAIRAFIGKLVSSSTNGWQLFTSRNGNPQTADEVNLYGGYARIATTITSQDGVALTNTYGYTANDLSWPYTGGVQTQVWSYANVDGELETYTQATTYAAMALSATDPTQLAYAQMAMANVLTDVAQLLTRMQVGAGSQVTTASSATTYSQWAAHEDIQVMDTQTQYSWVGDATGVDIGEFPFGEAPSDALWRMISQTKIRSKRGAVLESIDEAKMVHSTVYDIAGQAQVLIVSNASYAGDEVDFCGFEPEEGYVDSYEPSGWTLTGGAVVQTGNAHTGKQSLYLPTGAGAQYKTLTPTRNDRIYLFSCWYQLDGTTSVTGASFQIKVMQGSVQIGETLLAGFTAEPGEWAYTLVPIDLAAYAKQATVAGSLSLEISTVMGDATGIWIDDVHFSPRSCTYAAQLHDPLTKLPVARLGVTDQTWQLFYDRFCRFIGTAGPDGVAKGLRLSYYSRQGNPLAFNPADPNSTLRIKAQYGGSAQTFQNGNDWQKVWTADDPSAWTTSNGCLVHASTSASNTLTAQSSVTADYALHFELVSATGTSTPFTLGDGFQIAIGSAAIFTWDGQWTLSVTDGAQNQPSLASVQGSPGTLLVLLTGGYLLLYQDGQLLFSETLAISGTPEIISGNNALALRNLMLFEGPAVHLTQKDATGKRCQEQVLCNTEYLVNQYIQDAMGDIIVKTKSVPGMFGGGGAQPALQYRTSLVDLAAFLADLNTTALMSGDVSDYYDGSDVAGGRTNDQGYPYSRRLYEASSLKRMVEQGTPGQAYAIINPYTTPASSRHTTKMSYGNNAAITFENLKIPAGQYQLTTQTNQVGIAQITVKDAKGNTAATVVPNGSTPMITTNKVTYEPGGATTRMQLPNYFQALPGASNQLIVNQCNPLGQLVSETSPDSGTTQYMYDDAGWLRFFQDAEAADKGYLVYILYDEMGRKIARGTAVFDWTASSAATLQGYANLAAWPEANSDGVVFTRQLAMLYDGAGTHPEQIGNQVGAITYNGGKATVFEEMVWSKHGRLQSHTTTTKWSDDHTDGPFTTAYEYDNLGNTTSVQYPKIDGVNFSAIQYQYNGLSKITQVLDQDDNLLADFAYDATGNPITTTLGAQPVQGVMTYNSPGQLLDIADTATGGNFSSTATLNFDGSVETQTDVQQNGDGNNEFDLTYGYDEFACLQNASNAGDDNLTQGFAYANPDGVQDLNSNIWTINGVNAASLTYNSGTNQLYQAAWASQTTTTFEYLLNGSLLSRSSTPEASDNLADLTFTYAQGSTQTLSLDVGSDTTAEFVYDSNGNRVGKRVLQQGQTISRKVSIQGPLRPIAQVDEKGAGTAFVYGPMGLLAMVRDNTRYAVAVDRLGSTRAVFNPDGTIIAAYNYLAYGGFALRQEPFAGWMPLLFTGQEFDSESGLYNYNARLYDPAVCRFCTIDAALQYPSPYLYVGNHPTVYTDPTGNVSQMQQVGLALLTVALIGAGLAIGLVPMAFELEGAALVIAYACFGAVGGAVGGAGSSGLYYDATHNPADWNTGSFLWSMEIGAIGGMISGGISASILGGGMVANGLDKAGSKAVREAAGTEIASTVRADGVTDATSASGQLAKDAASSTKSASQLAGETFNKMIPYRLGGNAAGYFVSGLVTTPLTNYFVYHNSDIWSGIGLTLAGDVLLGEGMALLSGSFSYALNAWQLSTALNPGFSSVNTESLLWGGVVGSSVLFFGAGASAAGFVAVNNVIGGWYSQSTTN